MQLFLNQGAHPGRESPDLEKARMMSSRYTDAFSSSTLRSRVVNTRLFRVAPRGCPRLEAGNSIRFDSIRFPKSRHASAFCSTVHLEEQPLQFNVQVALWRWRIQHIEGRWIFNARVFKGYRIMTLLIYIYMYIEIANALSTPIDVDR